MMNIRPIYSRPTQFGFSPFSPQDLQDLVNIQKQAQLANHGESPTRTAMLAPDLLHSYQLQDIALQQSKTLEKIDALAEQVNTLAKLMSGPIASSPVTQQTAGPKPRRYPTPFEIATN